MNQSLQVLYRYNRNTRSSGSNLDYEGEFVKNSYVSYNYNIDLDEYKIIKETEKGYWIELYSFSDAKKWVSKTAKKRYAYPTKEEALFNFKKRTESAVKILSARLNEAKAYLLELNVLDAKETLNKSLNKTT